MTRNLVFEQPYQFVPPSRSPWWPRVLAPVLLPLMRKHWAHIRQLKFEGVELLLESIHAGHGVIVCPNHCRPVDPLVLLYLGWKHGFSLYGMTSWHLFQNHWSVRVLARRMGAFSILREGSDRESLDFAMQAVIDTERPVTILPEGGLSRTNDRLRPLLDGVALVARGAARRRAKLEPPGQVVLHPVAIKYRLTSPLESAILPSLDGIEKQLGLSSEGTATPFERIVQIIGNIVHQEETNRGVSPVDGDLTDRLEQLCRLVLESYERNWLSEVPAIEDYVLRVKNLRALMVPRLRSGELNPEEKAELWQQLEELDLVHQWALLFPRDYLQPESPPERFVETLERLQEYFTGRITLRGEWDVTVRVGESIPVPARRERHADGDPLMKQLRDAMQSLLDGVIRSTA